ncbi:MAG: A24 family peptidase [Desulfovibrionaceae bacterium]
MTPIPLLWPVPLWSFHVLTCLVGLVLGSFYNVCIHRYLTGESIVFPGSKCPRCGHPLAWWENIPVVSFCFLRGRCGHCRAPISLRYPVVELVSGAWALALALKFGPSMPWVVHMVVGGMCIVAAFIDFDSYLLPDILTLPGAVLAAVGGVFFLEMTWYDIFLGAGIGAGSFWALQKGYKLVRGVDGLGSGDVKLMLLIGAISGWRGLPVIITVAAATGIVASLCYMRRTTAAMQTMIPFGPFLILGMMLYVLWGDVFWAWYIG